MNLGVSRASDPLFICRHETLCRCNCKYETAMEYRLATLRQTVSQKWFAGEVEINLGEGSKHSTGNKKGGVPSTVATVVCL